MQIYTIKAGDTLWAISREYNVNMDAIILANEIKEPNRLVVGQTIVIPIEGSYYTLRAGDSLWAIGRRFGINYQELAQVNQIDPSKPLRIGLRLYIPPAPKTPIESNAYFDISGQTASPTLINDAKRAAPLLTYIAPFSYQAKSDGTLTPFPIDKVTDIAAQNASSLMMVVTNIQDGAFSGELASSILKNKEIQEQLLTNILKEVDRVGQFSDVHFDFEFLPGNLRVAYNEFLARAVERLKPAGLMVSSALAPKTRTNQPGQWYEAHDYKAHGEIVDFVVIMTYEWGYSAGPPLAVSPIGPVEQVLQYALTQIPADKIMMGQNLYGYDWTLPFVQGNSFAQAVSPQRAIDIARDNSVSIMYDVRAQAPYFNYTDAEGRAHVVWFEDAKSIEAKFDLLKRLKLRGISYWKLGLPFPQNWLLLDSNFDIIKK